MTSTVTVIGAGPIGQAITRALLSAGHEVTVWNRTLEKTAPLAELGAHVATTPREAVRRSDIALISVRGNDAARDILEQAELSGVDVLVVNLTSDTPSSARELAGWMTKQGVRYLSGTMLTPSVLVGQPGSTAVLGGVESIYEQALPVLEVIAPEVARHGDDPGAVAALDLALLDAFWGTVTAWSHAVALGRAEGLNANDLTERLTAIVHLAAEVGAGISQDAELGSYPGDVSTIASARSTLTHILHASTDRFIDAGFPGSVEALLRRATDHGYHDDGPSRLVPTIARAAH